MRLRRVKIFGFKTFADRTEFDFEGGLVAVVGANGCGKSNLVDAILWGLGEGNSRQLRAQSSQEVIFNGSPNRKPVGYAEVSLTFDNEDGSLPVQASEVTITRRLNRGGDSEYRLNRIVCRQRDIYELLADSGLGRSGYSIVGQRDIDAALSASAEDRRAWVDEAAGVQRYRQRRTEAQKRLAFAKDHLGRTIDILRELESQREPLREEAEVAIKYREYQSHFRSLEKSLLSRDYVDASARITKIESELSSNRTNIASSLQSQSELNSRISAIQEEICGIENKIETKRNERQAKHSLKEKLEGERRLVEQKLNSLASVEADLQSDAKALKLRIVEAQGEWLTAVSECESEASELEKVKLNATGVVSERNSVDAKLREIDLRLKNAQTVLAEQMKIRAENAHREDRKKEIDREIEGILASEKDVEEAVRSADEAYQKAKSALSEVRNEITTLEESLVQINKEERAFDEEHRRLLATKTSTVARAEALASTIEASEGVSQGARAVLEAVKAGKLQGDFLPVGLALKADRRLALAIETALGSAASDLIVPDESTAKRGVAYLKDNRAGRATFQPLPLLRFSPPSSELLRFMNQPGVIGRATDLVEFEPEHRPIAESLLGRIVIVETLEVAIRLSKGQSRPFNRLVTREGEVVHASGGVTGGVLSRQSFGLVQRKAEFDALVEDSARLSNEIMRFEERGEKRKVERNQFYLRLEVLQKMRSEFEINERETKEYLSALMGEKESSERSKLRLQREFEKLQSVSVPIWEGLSIKELEFERGTILERLASMNADADQFTTRLLEAEMRLKRAQERSESAERRLVLAKESDSNRHKKLLSIEPERIAHIEQMKAFSDEIEISIKLIQSAEEQIESHLVQRLELQNQMALFHNQLQSQIEICAHLTELIHKSELERIRIQSKLASTCERLAEEYEIFEEQLSELTLEDDIPEDAEQVLGRLRREMKAMGDVNVGAISAYERLNDRFTELEGQQMDISKGIEEVEASIRELDGKTRDRFTQALNQVQLHFSQLFQRLFGGGEGHLVLTDPEDVLNSGLEMDVTLPGKRKQALGLLSGGERSLCALAFLFGLLEVRQSPLVVLDEVDAPLDGRNVASFVQLLKDYSEKMQFIVITHNPTTIEGAPIWLGVTMQDPGCSTLVPYRTSNPRSESSAVVLA